MDAGLFVNYHECDANCNLYTAVLRHNIQLLFFENEKLGILLSLDMKSTSHIVEIKNS